MTTSKDSPKRRKSIAVLNQNKPSSLARARRRAHSIVAGDHLSPFAKARRSLAPRKSILKAFTNTVHTNDNPDSELQEPISSPDDPNATQSMDITKDFHTKISDHTTRKSFGGRRVSFAESVRVRLIEGVNKDNTNSTQSPQSSPISEPLSQKPSPVDENDYPGAHTSGRRRSSARYSIAYSEDMDLTSVGPQAFLPIDTSAVADEEIELEEGEEGMDMTGVISSEIIRKRSLSIGNRLPLAQISQPDPIPPSSDDHSQSQSFEESELRSRSADSDQAQPMDFTMPLSRSKRPPPEHDAAWLALRKATHSGDTPIEPEPSSDEFDQGDVPHVDNGMDLDDAVQRLMRARESLPSIPAIPNDDDGQASYDSTFSTQDSWGEQDNQTVNMSVVLGRLGQGDVEIGQVSMCSTMDESEVYNAILPDQSTPRQPEQPQIIFHPPPTSGSALAKPHEDAKILVSTSQIGTTSPSKFRTIGLSSPSKTKQPQTRTGFSAAFAPPVSRPSPKKGPQPQSHDVTQDMDKLSNPGSSKPIASRGFSRNTLSPIQLPKAVPTPSLSPHRKPVFQAPETVPPTQHPSSSLRRPSGYFAKRKSLSSTFELQDQDEAPSATRSPPKKQARLGFGRASLGSGLAHPWQRSGGDDESKTANGTASHRDQEADSLSVSPALKGSATPIAKPTQFPVETAARLVPAAAIVVYTDDDDDDANEGNMSNEGMEVVNTGEGRNMVEPNEFPEHDDTPPISIQQFFAMTNIKFMDELTAPRRSMYPSQQGTLQARNSEDIPLADYVSAIGIDLPQLVLYSRVSRDLEAWIEKSRSDFEQAEDEASKITPELFTEYSRADEEGQAQLLHQLQLIRTNTRALAKSDWYDWKIQWLEGLRVTADQTFQFLEADAKILENVKLAVDDIIPALKQEFDEITQLLETESAEVAEIEACDQGYLNELKASIAEQSIEVEALRAEVVESKAKYVSLQSRLEETNMLRKEAIAAIDNARQVLHIQKNGTRAEVIRLKSELETLEDLHMFRATKVDAGIFEPIVSQLEISRVGRTMTKVKDNFPSLSDLLLRAAQELVARGEDSTTRQIIHRLSDYWSSCAQLRAQLNLVLIKFPIDIEIINGRDDNARFKVNVTVVFPQVKAKALVSFVFHDKTFCHWPVAIRSLRCEVQAIYGPIDREVIANVVTERLNQATPEDNYGCLLDACIEAQESYRQ